MKFVPQLSPEIEKWDEKFAATILFINDLSIFLVGVAGFEPTTPTTPK